MALVRTTVLAETLQMDFENTPGYLFFSLCLDYMRNRDFKKVDWAFKDRFPPLENGKVYKFEDLADDWERAVSLTVTEALTFGYADIIDLSVEIFGEIIPPNPNNFSWTHHFHYDLEIVKRLHDFGAEMEFLNKVGGNFNSTPLYARMCQILFGNGS